ncbi:MAG: hypothetical protein KME03_19930 [Aphanocapsa lilacina HA4352-LM1]|jgi:hypothetical protein|nr:hypothetical protein [Aphanocapsa lilacina HA4352-LM1]
MNWAFQSKWSDCINAWSTCQIKATTPDAATAVDRGMRTLRILSIPKETSNNGNPAAGDPGQLGESQPDGQGKSVDNKCQQFTD